MAASFNQQIDGNRILPKIKVTAGGKPIAIRLVTDEVNSSHTVIQELREIRPKSWIAFQSVEPLPADSEIKVRFESGLPSAEGALTSAGIFSSAFTRARANVQAEWRWVPCNKWTS